MINRPAIYLGLLALACVPWFVASDYIFHIAAMIVIMIPVSLGMNLMLKIGQLSIAQPAFMGIGAYASALFAIRLGIPTSFALLLSGLLTALIALAVGPIFLRIKGVYFVLLTYAFGQIVNLIFQEWTSLFGGNNGLYGIPKFSIFGHRVVGAWQYYLLGLIMAVFFYAIVRAIERSDMGAILESLNENEMLSRAIGSNALLWRIAAFTFSAFAAGISGGVYAYYIGFLSPDAFGFRQSVDLIVINAIGGVNSVLGPVLGAIFIVPLPELLRDARQYQLLIYGLCLIVFLIFMRQGLISLFQRDRRVTP
jgi:branched-chain amino acid transport system permease protein